MSEAQHSDAPWMNNHEPGWTGRQTVYVAAKNWGVVATVNIDPSFAIHPRMLANLYLITAAPDLLDALRTVVGVMKLQRDVIEGGGNTKAWDGPIAYAEAAIAKATTPTPA